MPLIEVATGLRLAGSPARTVPAADLGLERDAEVQLGVAPEAAVVMISVLQGDYSTGEYGSLHQLLGGLNAAMNNKFDPEWGGYDCVVVPIELTDTSFGSVVSRRIDDVLQVLRANELLPIMAAGNSGTTEVRLGTRGFYVGAADRNGKVWKHSGEHDLLAPGVSMVCCQPALAQLGYQSLGVYSGTSLAAPFVAGLVCILQQATNAPAKECLMALHATSREGMIDPDAAHKELTWH